MWCNGKGEVKLIYVMLRSSINKMLGDQSRSCKYMNILRSSANNHDKYSILVLFVVTHILNDTINSYK